MTPFAYLDSLLIPLFQLPAPPEAAFLLGILALAVLCALLGSACAALVKRTQRFRWGSQEAEAKKRHELSIEAARAGDRRAYLAQNHLAQEAYGNTMALSAGRVAALCWPACVCLTWLYWRFDGVPMPLLWEGAGPANYFLPAFVAAQVGISRLLRKKNAASV